VKNAKVEKMTNENEAKTETQRQAVYRLLDGAAKTLTALGRNDVSVELEKRSEPFPAFSMVRETEDGVKSYVRITAYNFIIRGPGDTWKSNTPFEVMGYFMKSCFGHRARRCYTSRNYATLSKAITSALEVLDASHAEKQEKEKSRAKADAEYNAAREVERQAEKDKLAAGWVALPLAKKVAIYEKELARSEKHLQDAQEALVEVRARLADVKSGTLTSPPRGFDEIDLEEAEEAEASPPQ
jgi:hypothetical protein